jgi:hypothetical protein
MKVLSIKIIPIIKNNKRTTQKPLLIDNLSKMRTLTGADDVILLRYIYAQDTKVSIINNTNKVYANFTFVSYYSIKNYIRCKV